MGGDDLLVDFPGHLVGVNHVVAVFLAGHPGDHHPVLVVVPDRLNERRVGFVQVDGLTNGSLTGNISNIGVLC
jgi:hypothetical protein